jgi:hypothetical protein
MNLNHNTNPIQNNVQAHISKRNAYHQAGHAAAICLGNREKQLPAVHFQVTVKHSAYMSKVSCKYRAQVEGGRLLESLPPSFANATRNLSSAEQQLCRSAIEADIINLLAGPLSEAKYVALCDGEVFNANLVYLGALQFYSGKAELEIINDLMGCYLPNRAERKQKLAELFLASYSFINKNANWRAITTLAEAICLNPKEVYSCEELMALLDEPCSADKLIAVGSH